MVNLNNNTTYQDICLLIRKRNNALVNIVIESLVQENNYKIILKKYILKI